MTGTGHGQEALEDVDAFTAMAHESGWRASAFVRFYADGARKDLAKHRAAQADGNLNEVARLAHGARGSSATACVPKMAAAFLALEKAAAAGVPEETAQALTQAGALLDEVLVFLRRSVAEDP